MRNGKAGAAVEEKKKGGLLGQAAVMAVIILLSKIFGLLRTIAPLPSCKRVGRKMQKTYIQQGFHRF